MSRGVGDGKHIWSKLVQKTSQHFSIDDLNIIDRFKTLESLSFIDYPFLCEKNVGKNGERDQLLRCIQLLHVEENFAVKDLYKRINDPVLGTISLHPLAVLILDTPQFQRLHYIHQLSALHYVYPSAAYSRFEHSIGVYHLAGKLVNMFREQQPELRITAIDAMCVQLAGLSHDLGHGPFSHMFDRRVVPRLDPHTTWTHEKGSTDMLDHIFSCERVNKGFKSWGFTQQDFNFIKSLIVCEPNEELTGRGKCKSFLYEIVANGRNGMDVDKWDFLSRDSFHLGIQCGFEHDRLLYHMRVVEVGGVPQICVRDKEADAIYSMFYTRYDLYKKAYQHPVGWGVELLISEAIVKAGRHLKIKGKSMIECLDDMEAYTRLHDGIFFKILDSEEEELREARELLERLQRRELWKFIGQARVSDSVDGNKLGKEVISELEKLTGCEFRFGICVRHFGKKSENPLDYIRFYKKSDPTVACPLTAEQRLAILPQEFQHSFLVIYCTSADYPQEVFTVLENVFADKGLHVVSSRSA